MLCGLGSHALWVYHALSATCRTHTYRGVYFHLKEKYFSFIFAQYSYWTNRPCDQHTCEISMLYICWEYIASRQELHMSSWKYASILDNFNLIKMPHFDLIEPSYSYSQLWPICHNWCAGEYKLMRFHEWSSSSHETLNQIQLIFLDMSG